MVRTLYLLRHAQTVANVAQVYPQDDTPLTRAGIAQALAAAKYIQKLQVEERIDTILVSPLIRARDTALMLGVKAITVSDLRDHNLGELTGKPYGTLRSVCAAAQLAPETYIPEGGESYEQARDRVACVHRTIGSGSTLIITHTDTMHWLVELETGSPCEHGSRFENCALWVIADGIILHKNWTPWLESNE